MNNEERILQLLSGLKSDMGDLKQDLSEIRLDIENRINPQLAAKSRVDALESDVALLKKAVHILADDIAELKKAR